MSDDGGAGGVGGIQGGIQGGTITRLWDGERVWIEPLEADESGVGAGFATGPEDYLTYFPQLVKKDVEFALSKQKIHTLPNLWKTWKETVAEYHVVPPHDPAWDYRAIRPRLDPVLSDVEVASVIRAMINTIETYGWIQNSYGNVTIGFCVLGALGFVTERRVVSSNQIATRFSDWLKAHIDMGSIPHWNDDPDRTKDEILLYLHKFADELDPEGAGA